jgi:hypothetical protein
MFHIDPSLKMLEVNEDEEYFKTTGSNSLKGSLVSTEENNFADSIKRPPKITVPPLIFPKNTLGTIQSANQIMYKSSSHNSIIVPPTKNVNIQALKPSPLL